MESAVSVSVPAQPEFLKAIRGCLQPILEDRFGTETEMVVLAIDECCANFLKHRCAKSSDPVRSLTVTAELGESHLRFRIGDFCDAGEVPRIHPRDLADVRPGGLGTHFVSRIMDRVEFEPDPCGQGRMAIILEKDFPGA